jgi:hypothetical protein
MQRHIPSHNPSVRQPPARVINRVAALMVHIPWYSCRGISRLAKDAGVAKSALSNIIAGATQPNYATLLLVTEALAKRMGRPLDLREVAIAEGMRFPTQYPCDLFGCACLPPWAYDAKDALRPEFRDISPGEWTLEGPLTKHC